MPTLKLCTSFDHGLSNTTSLVKGNAGIKYADVLNGTPALVTTTPRTGTYCLECSATAAIESLGWNTDTLGTSQTVLVGGVPIYFPTSLPAADTEVFTVATSQTLDVMLRFRSSDSKLVLLFSDGTGTAAVGPTVTTNTWYWVDIRANLVANPYVIDWAVDGVAQTSASLGQAAATVSGFHCGFRDNAATATIRYDDPVLSTTSGDYPLGPHKVVMLIPDTAGTAVEIGTANATGRMVTNSAIDATFSSANILAAVSEVPPLIGATATGVGQRTVGATNAVGLPMTTYTLAAGETFSGLRVEIVGWAVSATANNVEMRTFNGTTETTLFAVADPNFDNDTAAPGWLCKMATAADFDTQAEVDALVVRFGYATDITPLVGAHAIYASVAVKQATATAAAQPKQINYESAVYRSYTY